MDSVDTRSAMDKKKAELYRKRLLAKQEELLHEVSKSDQDGREADEEGTQDVADKAANAYTKEFLFHQSDDNRRILQLVKEALARLKNGSRSEEHTSELQSQSNLVCRLLLEKKKENR